MIKVPNLQKYVENQRYWAGAKPRDEHGKTKLPSFASQLKNLYL